MRIVLALIASLFLDITAADAQSGASASVDDLASSYVELMFGERELNPDTISVHAPRPDEEEAAKAAKRDAPAIAAEAKSLLARLDDLPKPTDRLAAMRLRSLRARVLALQSRMEAAGGAKWPVAEEVARYYGFTPAFRPLSEYDAALDKLDKELVGEGSLPERIAALRTSARVPPDKIEAVFNAAIAECGKRAARYLQLPPNSIQVSFTESEMVPAEELYLGAGKSQINVSKVIPTDVDRLLQGACHEVYPGHHAHMVIADHEMVKRRGWVEYAVEAIPGPLFPLAEAIAEFGIGLTFPVDDRLAFERDVLYPLAGLKMEKPEAWRAYISARPSILGASSTVGRDFLDKKIDEKTAHALFVRYRLQTPEAASQLIKMLPMVGTGLIASDMGWYTVDRALRGKSPEKQWQLLYRMASEPMLLDDIAALASE